MADDLAKRIAERLYKDQQLTAYSFGRSLLQAVAIGEATEIIEQELAPLLEAVDAVLAPPDDKPFGAPRVRVEIEVSRINALRAAREGRP